MVLKRYFQRKTTKSPPIITAKIKPAIPICDVQNKDAKSSPKSLKSAKRVLTELTIIRRAISMIISNGVLTMLFL